MINEHEQAVMENFENMKKVEHGIISTQAVISQRIDMLVDIRDKASEFFHEDLPLTKLKLIQAKLTNLYHEMENVVEGYSYEDFSKPEMADPFEDMVPKVEDCNDDEELFVNYMAFLCVRPFAERAIKLNRLVVEELENEVEVGEAAED